MERKDVRADENQGYMYEINIKKKFRARHALPDEKPHEHEFICEVTIAGAKLNSYGCVIDFALVDEALAKITADLSMKLLGSTETIAETIYRRMDAVARIIVWEDERHSASYFET